MKIKKILLNFFLISISFIFFAFFSKIYIEFFDINRHWSSSFDQELTFTYNALLFNSGIKQEFLDHSAYFTILFLSIFIKISEILNLIELYNLRTLLERGNIDDSLQEIIPYVRIYTGVTVAIWAVIANILFYQLSNSKIFSFFITLFIFTMPGTIDQLWRLRTELMSSIFMILSLIMLIVYLKNITSKHQNLKLFFFFFFLFSSILNKSQVFFYVPLLILFSLFFFEKINQIKFDFIRDLKGKKYLYFFIFIVISYTFLKLIVYKGSFLSLLFILFTILFLNLICYFMAKKSGIDELTYINHFNLILISSFILFKAILFIHPSTNELAFNKSFTDIMGILKYMILDSSTENTLNFFKLLQVIFSKLLISIKKYLFEINIYSLLIVLIITLNFYFKKNIGKKNFIFNFSCLILPILMTFIGSFRGLAEYYHIFWDFFFLLPFCIFYRYINLRFSYFLIIILSCFTYLNYQYIINTKSDIALNNTKKLCDNLKMNKGNNYLEAFQKKIPREMFEDFCSISTTK